LIVVKYSNLSIIEKMDKQSVQKLVNKLVKDAERRKISTEKIELLKVEEENKVKVTFEKYY